MKFNGFRKATTPIHILCGIITVALLPVYPVGSALLFSCFFFLELWNWRLDVDKADSWLDFHEYSVGLFAAGIALAVLLWAGVL